MASAKDPVRRPAVVSEVQQLSPHLVRLGLRGPALCGLPYAPGHKVKIQAGEVLRSYTPSRYDGEEGELDVVVHLHGRGPASHWVARAQVGEPTMVVGPSASMPAAEAVDWAAFFGDETTLGLARALLDALPATVRIGGALELESEDFPAVDSLGLPLTPVERRAGYGTELIRHARTMDVPEGEGVIWLSGHATTVLTLRNLFLERGVPKHALKVKPYWSDRGHAYRKKLERSELR